VSLRRRLLIGILALLVVAIGVTDVVTYSSLRSFLLGQLDEETDVAQHQVFVALRADYERALLAGSPSARSDPTRWLARLLAQHGGAPTCPSAGEPAVTPASEPSTSTVLVGPAAGIVGRVSPDVFVEVLAPDRAVLFSRPSGVCDPRPRIPADMPVQAVPTSRPFGARQGAYFPNQLSFTTGSIGSSTQYRAEAVQVPGGILVTAVALTPDEETLSSVVRIEVFTSVVVLGLAVVVALLVTRLGLAPLEEMTATAVAIGGGDLSRRIRTTDRRSEVGRLGAALNGMLSQIEGAFAQRSQSEARLRRFVADASHELRTPLTSVRGYAELLRKGAFGDERERVQAAARIEAEAAHMGVLVDDLLLLARLDQGRPLDRASVDLAAVAEEAVEAARVAHPTRRVDLTLRRPVGVLGDAARLRQVVDNLVGNALEHTPDDAVVEVEVGAEGSEALLAVADTGPGLTAEQASHVFEPFYRASSSRTGGGVGLGLSIVAALVHAHGGRVTVRTSPGHGCRFEVRMPGAAPPGTGVAGGGDSTPVEVGR
jgi:two-component system OmpR family sensor kinase